MAADCLKYYQGDTVLYVGEGCGGCTGDDNFHERLEDEFELIEEMEIPQWNGIHDWLYHYSRVARMTTGKYGPRRTPRLSKLMWDNNMAQLKLMSQEILDGTF